MPDLNGQLIERYQIKESLGEGGMATVYKAYDTRLEREVAVKFIRREAVSNEQYAHMLRRFEREARTLAKLVHPNIIPVYDYGEYQGSPYLVMSYVSGGTLKDHMGRPFQYSESARLLIPVARALDYAHQMGIIHRDVKPANILLSASGEPMLSDFGIAHILESVESTRLTNTGVAIGTPEYMAPEQAKGEDVDHRADIYALGIIYYELVTGKKPFQGDTPMSVLIKHVTDLPPSPRLFVPSLPDAVLAVLSKALAKTPQERYQSMGEFGTALEKLASQDLSFPTFQAQSPEEATSTAFYGAQNQLSQEIASKLESTIAKTPPPVSSPPQKSPTIRWLAVAGLLGSGFILIVCVILGFVWYRQGIQGKGPFAILAKSIATPTTNGSHNPTRTQTVSIIFPTGTLTITQNPTSSATPVLTPTTLANTGQSNGLIVFNCYPNQTGLGFNDICLYDFATSQSTIITDGTANSTNPALSHDRRYIVFNSNRTGDQEIYLMNRDGSGLRQLTNDPGYNDERPRFSPDDSKLIIQRENRNGGGYTIWTMSLDGSNLQLLVEESSNYPEWSPDGRWISFVSDRSGGLGLFTLNLSSGEITQITIGSNVINGPTSWSSDNNMIAFDGNASGNREIYLVNRDGSNLHQVTNGGDNFNAFFSPDGNWIAYASNKDGEPDIYIMHPDGSQVRDIINNSFDDWRPYWVP
jgi:serine/threonine protein kinase